MRKTIHSIDSERVKRDDEIKHAKVGSIPSTHAM